MTHIHAAKIEDPDFAETYDDLRAGRCSYLLG